MILAFGKTGQVAIEIARLSPDALCCGRTEVDLLDPEACAAVIRDRRPRAVINAAAYTAVDRAEDEEKTAYLVNAEAPGSMAAACADLGVPFVHISTDYVFDGQGTTPFAPSDLVAPLGAYGRTKAAGEAAVRQAGGTHAILRTSWVFSAHGSNFVKTMLRLAETRDALRIVDDQVGGPTPASAIAAACLKIADGLAQAPELSGTYHFAGTPNVSWAGFANEIFARANRSVAVTPVPSVDYPTPAPRPLNSRLDCGAIDAAFGIARPDWRAALDRVLADSGHIEAKDPT